MSPRNRDVAPPHARPRRGRCRERSAYDPVVAVFENPVSVRWSDTDALGHVNHSVFLTYLEEGRYSFFANVLGSDPIYVVVRLEVDLRAEVHHEDRQVMVRIAVERMGATSLTTHETVITSAQQVAAQARV